MNNNHYKVEVGISRYPDEFEARLYVKSHFLIFSWWCHLRTVRNDHATIAEQTKRWQKRFDIPDYLIEDNTVDFPFEYYES
jgi:hypothetical protein